MPSPNPHVGVPKPSTSECALIWKYGVSQDEVTLARVGLPLIKGGAVGTEGTWAEMVGTCLQGMRTLKLLLICKVQKKKTYLFDLAF